MTKPKKELLKFGQDNRSGENITQPTQNSNAHFRNMKDIRRKFLGRGCVFNMSNIRKNENDIRDGLHSAPYRTQRTAIPHLRVGVLVERIHVGPE